MEQMLLPFVATHRHDTADRVRAEILIKERILFKEIFQEKGRRFRQKETPPAERVAIQEALIKILEEEEKRPIPLLLKKERRGLKKWVHEEFAFNIPLRRIDTLPHTLKRLLSDS